jgi:ribosomal protein L11 methyltransferase
MPDDKRIPIRIDPGMAFGTGTHPSTQLCLEILSDYILQNEIVIDIGCGSGILSIASVKLGADKAFGVDLDPEAITIAKNNAKSNNVGNRVNFAKGSATDVINGVFKINQAPLVVANILAHILKNLLNEGLDRLVKSGGILILSGILEDQTTEIINQAIKKGFEVIDQRQIEDWVGIALRKNKVQ